MTSRLSLTSINCSNLNVTADVNITGKIVLKRTNVSTGSYTPATTDLFLLCDTSTGAITINLLAASGVIGQRLVIVDTAGQAATNNITITPNGSDTIQGENSNLTVNVNNASIDLLASSSTAYVIV